MTASSAVRASRSSTSPAAVSLTCRVVRTSSATPSCRSRSRIARDSGGCAMPSREAARPKCSSSATATKYRSCRTSRSFILPEYQRRPDRSFTCSRRARQAGHYRQRRPHVPVASRLPEVLMIVITTPTGKIGRQVLDRVLDSGAAVRVIARDPARLPARCTPTPRWWKAPTATQARSRRRSTGADRMFWLVPPPDSATPAAPRATTWTSPARPARRPGLGVPGGRRHEPRPRVPGNAGIFRPRWPWTS